MADERFKVDIVAGDQYSREFARFNRQMGLMSTSAVAFGRLVLGAFSVKGVVNFGQQLTRVQRRFDAIDATFRSVEGSAAGAEAAFDDAADIANTLGLDLVSTAKSFAQFNAAAKGTALEGDAARDIFESVSIAASALQLDAYDTRGAMRALEQMISKGNVQAEELRGQLGERLPGAFQLAARAMNVTTSELNDMLENGEVLADDLLPKLAALLREDYTAGARQGAESLNGDISRLNNSLNETGLALSQLLSLEEVTEVLGAGFAGLADIVGFLEQEATRVSAAMVSGNIREQLESVDEQIGDIKGLKERFLGRERFLASLPEQERQALEALERERQRLATQLELANAALRESFGIGDSDAEGDAGPKASTAPLKEVSVPDSVLKSAEERSKRLEELNRDLARSLDALRSPAQIAADEIAKYEAGLAVGAITQEQFNALVLAARDRFLEASPALAAAIEQQQALSEAQQEAAQAQQEAFDLFSDLDPITAYAEAVRELTDAFNLLTPEQIEALGGAERVQEILDENIAKLGERFTDVQETGDLFAGLEEGLAGAITRGVTDGADGALDAFSRLLQQMAAKALEAQLTKFLFAGAGGGGGGLLGALGGFFGGARADGGSVTGGKTYLVGERGPELFTAGRTGTITPNDAMGGGLTYAPVVTIQGGATEQDRAFFAQQLEAQKAELFDLARRGRL